MSPATVTCGVLTRSVSDGIPLLMAIGFPIPASATRSFPAIRGDGRHIATALGNSSTVMDGAGTQVQIGTIGRRFLRCTTFHRTTVHPCLRIIMDRRRSEERRV